ncbi:MAG: hypothetical protein DWG76_02950 [Chloroflexi bacterium]|nr:hypothetical protein [Chloroflexota bacterium]MQC26392.1 hypothetical protein [Chloroflexota bacterium]
MKRKSNGAKRRLVSERQGDLFTNLGRDIRLIVRLMADGRVNTVLKLLPVFSLLYLISPLDFAIPLIDDALILWVGNTLFLELSPPEIVQEHRAAIETTIKSDPPSPINEGDIIDAEYTAKNQN